MLKKINPMIAALLGAIAFFTATQYGPGLLKQFDKPQVAQQQEQPARARDVLARAEDRTAPSMRPINDDPRPPAPATPNGLSREQLLYAASVRLLTLGEQPLDDPIGLFLAPPARLNFAGQLNEGKPIATPPWFVQIAVQSRWRGQIATEHCGGTVISSRLVLSAAHCFISQDGETVEAINVVLRIAPESRDDPRAKVYESQTIAMHSDFEGLQSSFRDDMALVVMPEPLPVANIIPRSAYATLDAIGPGQILCALGMGLDKNNELLTRTHIKRLNVERVGGGSLGLSPAFGEAFRPGDSGGPLVLCDKEGNILSILRLSGIVSSFSGEDASYRATITSMRRAWLWLETAGPVVLKVSG